MAEYHTSSGKLADPEFRSQRARAAALASHDISAHVRAVVRHSDLLTPEQRAEIRAEVATWPPLTTEDKAGLAAVLLDGGADAT